MKADLQQLLDRAAAAEIAASQGHGSSSISSSSSSNGVAAASEAAGLDADSTVLGGQQEAPAAGSSRQVLDSDHPFANVAIWQLPVVPLFFEADRPSAKELAKQLMAALKG